MVLYVGDKSWLWWWLKAHHCSRGLDDRWWWCAVVVIVTIQLGDFYSYIKNCSETGFMLIWSILSVAYILIFVFIFYFVSITNLVSFSEKMPIYLQISCRSQISRLNPGQAGLLLSTHLFYKRCLYSFLVAVKSLRICRLH